MTNVKSIYGSYENSNAEEAEVIIKTQMDECFENFLSLMEDLIIEDNRNKKNLRYIRKKKKLTLQKQKRKNKYVTCSNIYTLSRIFSRISWKRFVR